MKLMALMLMAVLLFHRDAAALNARVNVAQFLGFVADAVFNSLGRVEVAKGDLDGDGWGVHGPCSGNSVAACSCLAGPRSVRWPTQWQSQVCLCTESKRQPLHDAHDFEGAVPWVNG
jgi:hypothetical protein